MDISIRYTPLLIYYLWIYTTNISIRLACGYYYDIIRSPDWFSHILTRFHHAKFSTILRTPRALQGADASVLPGRFCRIPWILVSFDPKVLDFCWARLWCSNRPWWSVSVSISPSPTAVFGNNSSALKWTSMWAGEVWQNHPPISFPWIFWSLLAG